LTLPPPATLTIDAVEVLEVRVPRREDLRITTSYATLPDAHHALVRLAAGDVVGIGEAPAELWWTGEDAATVRNAVDRYLAPALLGQAVGPRGALARMDAALAGHAYAKAAVEMALWDALGKTAGLPLWALLGGGPPRPVPIKWVIGLVSPDDAAALVAPGRAAGFSTFKVKVGGRLADDLARVDAVREALRPGERVGVDANGGWSPVSARAALDGLAAREVAFVEQPVDARLPDVMAELTRRSAVPVVAHESIFTVQDAVRAARDGIGHAWALTPSTHGGLVPTLDILAIARAHGVEVLLGSTVELGVATALMAHLGAAFDELTTGSVPSDVIGPLYHVRDVVAPAIAVADGLAHAPNGPGLGVELDADRLAEFSVA
jgi:muconate cycloisomerase